MQTMKILHVIPGLANSSGPTRVVINVSERLVRLGCEVSIFHLTGRGYDRVLPKDPRVEVKGFPIDWSRRWGYSRSLGKALREWLESQTNWPMDKNEPEPSIDKYPWEKGNR